MKTIVLVALLAAAGCSKKAASVDCDTAIGKGIDNIIATINERKAGPQAPTQLVVVDKVKAVLLRQCKDDHWNAEALTCFSTVTDMRAMNACEKKLTEEQQRELRTEIRQVVRGARGAQMPEGVPGHPPALGSAGAADGSAAPETGSAPAAPAPAAPAAPAAGSPEPPAAGSAKPGGW